MRDRIGAGLLCYGDQLLGDQRARDRGAEKVLALVDCIGAEHREHKVAHELFAQVLDEDVLLADAHLERLGACRRHFLALADVGRERHDLAAIHVLQPFEDDRGVEAA
jgi:hypothetical protein